MIGSIRIELPEIIRMLVPHDYAKACGGRPLRIEAATEYVENALVVEWTKEELRFRSCDIVVIYERDAVVRFGVNRKERILGEEFCTLRIAFRSGDENDGKVGSLCVIGPNCLYTGEFNRIIATLQNSGFPFPIGSSVDNGDFHRS